MSRRKQTITEADLKALDQRNIARSQKFREAMGSRYLCHPAHRVQRCEEVPESSVLAVQRQLMFFGKNDGNKKETHYPFKAPG